MDCIERIHGWKAQMHTHRLGIPEIRIIWHSPTLPFNAESETYYFSQVPFQMHIGSLYICKAIPSTGGQDTSLMLNMRRKTSEMKEGKKQGIETCRTYTENNINTGTRHFPRLLKSFRNSIKR